MGPNKTMGNLDEIPTIDFSVFFTDNNDEKARIMETISKACCEFGFFKAINHGIPLDLMNRAMELSETFFDFPDDEKLKSRIKPGSPFPAGYGKQPEHSTDKNEFLLMLPPGNTLNVFPDRPNGFREAFEELFNYFSKTGQLVERILNDSLGLPPNFLSEYNDDRSRDLMTAKRYFPANQAGDIGIWPHQDGNIITFVFQDDVGGLEVLKDGNWLPIVPTPGSIIVNIGDIIQVLTNGKFKSATHRVIRQQGRNRHSFSFFYSLHGDKWVEPFPQLTREIGEMPKYKGFVFNDYQVLRIRNKIHPPSDPKDEINITRYAISS